MHKEYKVQLPNGHCPRADADADADANILLLVSSLIRDKSNKVKLSGVNNHSLPQSTNIVLFSHLPSPASFLI